MRRLTQKSNLGIRKAVNYLNTVAEIAKKSRAARSTIAEKSSRMLSLKQQGWVAKVERGPDMFYSEKDLAALNVILIEMGFDISDWSLTKERGTYLLDSPGHGFMEFNRLLFDPPAKNLKLEPKKGCGSFVQSFKKLFGR